MYILLIYSQRIYLSAIWLAWELTDCKLDCQVTRITNVGPQLVTAILEFQISANFGGFVIPKISEIFTRKFQKFLKM